MMDFQLLKINSMSIYCIFKFHSNTLFSWWAAAKPDGPEPTTATFFPVLRAGSSGWIQPCSNAWSMMAHSMFLMVTGGSLIPSTHAPSHGAGHTLPVNSVQRRHKEKIGKSFHLCWIYKYKKVIYWLRFKEVSYCGFYLGSYSFVAVGSEPLSNCCGI